MPVLSWDQIGSKFYETGIDRGVLYQSFGVGVAWNGLTSVSENTSNQTQSVFYDGRKINELVTIGEYSGSLTAFTYPEEFLDYTGYAKVRDGMSVGSQPLKRFGLSYRTSVGSDVSEDAGYKVHILYNLLAIPSARDSATFSEDPEISEFSWELTAIPNELPGYWPSAHFVLDSRYLDAELLDNLETILYGSELFDPRLPTEEELLEFVEASYIISIVDNGDGTWTATTLPAYDYLIDVDIDDKFTITMANAVYLDSETYEISSTLDSSD